MTNRSFALLASYLIGTSHVSAQCEDLTGSAGVYVECAGASIIEHQWAGWSGGTAPYNVTYEIAGRGSFSETTAGNGWTVDLPTLVPEGQTACGYSSLYVQDANGCAFEFSNNDCIYWLAPADQFSTASIVWDDPNGTATVTLVDNASDPGDVLQYPDLDYGLHRTDIADPGTSGDIGDIYQAAPPRLVLTGLVPGTYALEIGNPGEPFVSPVYCQGLAHTFTVVDPSPQQVALNVRALLGGVPVVNNLMNDPLRAAGLIPLQQPYSASGYMFTGSHGANSITPPILAATGANAVVDWVVVELRATTLPFSVLASRPALIQRDGDVVSTDGLSALTFNVPPGNYRVSIRHRNHLGAMTASTFALSSTAVLVDLTSTATPTYGSSAQGLSGSKKVLWPGDATGNGTIRYTGTGNDRDPIILAIGGSTPNNTLSNVYDRRDTNLDGVIKYTGAANDRDIILINVGSTTPNNTRTQQLP